MVVRMHKNGQNREFKDQRENKCDRDKLKDPGQETEMEWPFAQRRGRTCGFEGSGLRGGSKAKRGQALEKVDRLHHRRLGRERIERVRCSRTRVLEKVTKTDDPAWSGRHQG